jgi:hypothetical protein
MTSLGREALKEPADEPFSHIELLAISRHVCNAAAESDADQLHLDLCRLKNALVVHVQAERPRINAMRETSRRILINGQRRLINMIDDLLSVADDGATGCPCIRRSAELTQMLVRQARLESAVTSRSPLSPCRPFPLCVRSAESR